MRHTREGWPKCCGQVMDYVTSSAERCPACGRADAFTFPAVSPSGQAVRIVCMLCALSPDGETKS